MELVDLSGCAGLHDCLLAQAAQMCPQRGRALDLGAGTGALSVRLRKLGFEVTAVDVDRQRFKADIHFLAQDLNDPSFPDRIGSEHFDLVVCVEVIEHLESPIGFLRGLRTLLRPNGVVIITTPNVDSLPARLKFLFSGTIRMLDPDGEPTHITPIFWDLLSRQWLSRARLQLVKRFSFPPDGLPRTRAPVELGIRALARLIHYDLALGDHLVVVLTLDRG